MSRLKQPLRPVLHDEGDLRSDTSSQPGSLGGSEMMEDKEEESGHSNDGSIDDGEKSQSERDEPIQSSIRNISFGALVSAQNSLLDEPPLETSTTNRAPSRTDASKVSALRDRLAELRALKRNRDPSSGDAETARRKFTDHPQEHRSSKHAPTSQSSKRAVRRFRPVVADLSSNPTHIRDPRFAPIVTAVDAEKLRRNYSFLDTYRASEVASLKTTLSDLKAKAKKRKSHGLTPAEEAEKANLQKAINAMENRAKADEARDRLREVERSHRKEEREAVKQGKKPFFLKRSEVKKQALTQRWEGMKGKDREKAVKRRRKKISERERRAMPRERRDQDV